jgi:signal transduction histidine kinase
MEGQEFAGFLSGVASRLRHDLKGGLITLRMGLEALPDEEALKPLLIERALHLESLSDKLVLLLRMGEMRSEPMRLSALLGEFRRRVADRFPDLDLSLPSDLGDLRPRLDGDALLYALLEVAENAKLAGAQSLKVSVAQQGDQIALTLADNGKGAEPGDLKDLERALLPLGASRWGRGGLGLAIVERCAAAHAGGVQLFSPDGKGLSVVLRLGSAS